MIESKKMNLYGKLRTVYKKNCLFCSTEFWTRKDWFEKQKFCSPYCVRKQKSKENSFITECAECGSEIVRRNSRKKATKHGLYFCNRLCKEKAQSIGGLKELHPSHYGTGNGIRGYRKLAFSSFPNKCKECGYKKFLEVLIVHHKDRNRENNVIENLEILCPTCHMEKHFLSDSGLWTNNRGVDGVAGST